MQYKRCGHVITDESGSVETHKSINAAKRASRKLQTSGNKVSVEPHKRGTKHIPGKQPFNGVWLNG